jgi:transposase
MLKPSYYTQPTEFDLMVYEKMIPKDHILRQFNKVIDFERFRDPMKGCYHPSLGRSAEDPVIMLKLEVLQFVYGLSDRKVLKEVQVNVAFREFLGISIDSKLPSIGLLPQFRRRLGTEQHQVVFGEVIRQARQHGLIKDDQRLTDVTHVIANVAVPATLQLVAQTRERLLRSAKPYAQERVKEEQKRAEEIRKMTAKLTEIDRLRQRVEHLRKIVGWADEIQKKLGEPREKVEPQRQHFDKMLEIAHRIVDESENPDQKDRTRSSVDPDARRGKHGAYYDGYQLGISMDAESEIITAVSVAPANQDEAANAANLVKQEQETQKNRIIALSIDGIGFRGDVLRKLKDPNGLGLIVYVPPRNWPTSPYYTSANFHLEEDGTVLVCPNEEESRSRSRNECDTGWQFGFKRSQCKGCPFLSKCMEKLPEKHGRQVNINDYEAEYQAARELSLTEEYAEVRKLHPKIERKLAEIVRYHQGRRARFWGKERVTIQYLLTTIVVNLKRMAKLLLVPAQGSVCL